MDIYRDIILDAAKHPQHFGKLEGADVTAYHLNPSCGDDVTVYLKVDENDKITDIAWEGQGCVISRASMSQLSGELMGMTLAETKKIATETLLKLLGMDEIAPGREKCLLIGLTAVQKVIKK